jgi:hypothetical protein
VPGHPRCIRVRTARHAGAAERSVSLPIELSEELGAPIDFDRLPPSSAAIRRGVACESSSFHDGAPVGHGAEPLDLQGNLGGVRREQTSGVGRVEGRQHEHTQDEFTADYEVFKAGCAASIRVSLAILGDRVDASSGASPTTVTRLSPAIRYSSEYIWLCWACRA